MAVTEDPVKIIEVQNGKARIRISRFSMCAHCHLADWANETRIFEVWVDNKIGARSGDFVHVEMTPKKFLLSIFILFGVPLIGLFTGIIAASLLHLSNLLAGQILLGLCGYGISYIVVWRVDKYALKSNKFIPATVKKVRIKQNLLTKPME